MPDVKLLVIDLTKQSFYIAIFNACVRLALLLPTHVLDNRISRDLYDGVGESISDAESMSDTVSVFFADLIAPKVWTCCSLLLACVHQ